MYEIYINDRPLRLIATKDLEITKQPTSHLTARYIGKVKTLLHYADLLEKGSPKVTEVTIHHSDLEQLWTDFKSHYKWVPAAGGVVNLKGTNTFLFIHRRGYLDLPKGKIDPGETIEEAALREVEEETGVSDLSVIVPRVTDVVAEQIGSLKSEIGNCKSTTLHTYRTKKGKRILKPTYWYAMETAQIDLIPQSEEDIDWARWMTFESALNGELDFYPSLRCLLKD